LGKVRAKKEMEKPNRITELMLALITKNLEPPNGKYRIIDAFTARNLPVHIGDISSPFCVFRVCRVE
jgi:hypothetical protein